MFVEVKYHFVVKRFLFSSSRVNCEASQQLDTTLQIGWNLLIEVSASYKCQLGFLNIRSWNFRLETSICHTDRLRQLFKYLRLVEFNCIAADE